MKHSFVSMALLCLLPALATAQSPVTSASTSYVSAPSGVSYTANGAPNSGLSSIQFNFKYGNTSGSNQNNRKLNTFTAAGKTFQYVNIANSFIKMRRVNNTWVSGTRNLKFEEGSLDESSKMVKIVNSYEDNMEVFFNGNTNFNTGTDNLFANDATTNGDGNVNNIERVDVIFPDGYTPSNNNKFGFGIFERGDNGAHDPFKIAIILSLDASKNPSSYSVVKSVTSSNYGADLGGIKTFIITRKDNGSDTRLRPSTTVTQSIGGVLMTMSDFNLPANTKVYGYSILPNDFTGTSADVVDYNNAAHYPTATSANTGEGGIDLIGITGLAKDITVPLPLDLLSFDARINGNAVGLQWKTGNEKNTDHFEVEYSTDGSAWQTIGNVKANGSGNNSYTFLHESPQIGSNFYRLLMSDLDGSYALSETQQIRLNGLTDRKAGVYPNPASGKAVLTFSHETKDATVVLYNVSGTMVQQYKASGATASLDLSTLAPGVYQAVVTEGNQVIQRERIVHQ